MKEKLIRVSEYIIAACGILILIAGNVRAEEAPKAEYNYSVSFTTWYDEIEPVKMTMSFFSQAVCEEARARTIAKFTESREYDPKFGFAYGDCNLVQVK